MNAFLASFHNYQQVIQGNEVEAFSLWKLLARQGQQGTRQRAGRASVLLEVKPACPGASSTLPHLDFCSSVGHGAHSWHGRKKKQRQGQVAKDDYWCLVLHQGVRPMNVPLLCVQRAEEDVIEPFAQREGRVQWHVSRDHAKLVLWKIIKLCDSLSQEMPE